MLLPSRTRAGCHKRLPVITILTMQLSEQLISPSAASRPAYLKWSNTLTGNWPGTSGQIRRIAMMCIEQHGRFVRNHSSYGFADLNQGGLRRVKKRTRIPKENSAVNV
jgi:hypothetical protein